MFKSRVSVINIPYRSRNDNYFDVSEPENISAPPAKRPGSRYRSDHFWSFRSLRKRILASGETAGLPFAK